MSLGLVVLVCFALAVPMAWVGRKGGAAAWLLCAVGCVGSGVVGARGVAGHSWSSTGGGLVSALWPGSGPGLAMQLDPLTGLFLLLLGVVGVPAVLVAASWWWHDTTLPTRLPAASGLMLASCYLVIAASNAWALIIGWEGVTLAFYWLTISERSRAGRVDAALAALGFGKISGACLTVGLFLLAANSHSTLLAELGSGRADLRAVGYVLLLTAFAIKVGLVPLHVWLPRSYAAAPGPIRALMAGVAVNVGFYGCWRTLDVLGPPPGWLADVVMVLGGLSALIGIAHAAVQTSLTRVVAYSSVENAGLILAAFGVALIGASTGMPQLEAAGLLAATLQTVAHALGKTLLFASAGVVESAIGTDDLDQLRGVGRVLPWSGTGLAVGAFTMAGMPPGVVFVSEWFILETLMQQFRLGDHLAYALPMALTGALVALTAGFAGIAFIRLVAFTVLGRTSPRLQRARPREVSWLGRVGIVSLCLGCVVVAGLTPYEISVIAHGLGSFVPPHIIQGSVTGWVLGPVYPGFSVLSPSWLCLELPLMVLAVLLVAQLFSRGRLWAVREVPPWRSATGGVSGADEYTPSGYANPTRHVLANVLRPYTEIQELEEAEQRRTGSVLAYRADVVEVTEHYLYRPLIGVFRRITALVLRLQGGRLDAYLLYMLIALVAVLAVVTAGW